MKIFYRISLTIFLIANSLPVFCQSKSALTLLIDEVNSRHEQLPVEKLYLQTDKANYIQNDTLWFKAYLFKADLLTASPLSGLMYIELDNENNTCVKRIMVPVVYGLTWGNIALDEDEIPEGSYTLRAYTNWMRNFGEDYVFKKQVNVSAPHSQSHLISTNFKENERAGKNNVRAAFSYNNLSGQPLILQDMRFTVTDGRHTIAKTNVKTDFAGKLFVNFDLSPNTDRKNLYIMSQDIVKGAKPANQIIPVILNRPENIDLQFMPEGGSLVAGINSRVGFKAINEDGKGAEVNGIIYNSRNEVITSLKSAYKGMGSFSFMPLNGETYTAKINFAGGLSKVYLLPMVKPAGVTLRVNNFADADSLQVIVNIIPQIAGKYGSYYLLGSSRNLVCYATHFNPDTNRMVISVPKSAFATGIAHITLMNNERQPLAERIVFIEHNDGLQINIQPNKKTYAPHDSVAMNIKVTDRYGKPVSGSFSLSVTDDNQVKTDSLNDNMISNLLLTSDLKGDIEDPGYYFDDQHEQRSTDLDNLLLTQGWIGYDWKQIFAPPTPPQYTAEPEFAIHGTITNIFNKPVSNSPVSLLSKKPVMALDTVTGNDGRFVFKGFLPVDTASFFIQARNKHNKSFNVNVNIDEFKPPAFTQKSPRMMPWYVNSDTVLLQNLDAHNAKQQADIKMQGLGHILQEVKITDKKVIKDSKNLNGPGAADQILDEEEIVKAGKVTLYQLLQQKVKGFNEGLIFPSMLLRYKVSDEEVFFVFDGVFLNRFYTPTGEYNSLHNFIKGYLDYYTAEDIKGIEVMYSTSYSARYVGLFISPRAMGDPIAFIEITTRGGQGPFMKRTAGTFLYKPLPATLPKQFYSPKYSIKGSNHPVDLRSTIFWQPNVVTDTTGNAKVFFYTADKPSTYTITLEGTDLNGGLGFKRRKILVRP